jgi:hypothetical protein
MTTAVRPKVRWGLAVLALVNSVAAVGGAVGLATGTVGLDDNLNARLPFASPVFGAIALALLVAVPFALVAVLAWRGDERADLAATAAGLVLVGWIAVQLAFLRSLSFFHPFYVAMGCVFVWLGRSSLRRRADLVRRSETVLG